MVEEPITNTPNNPTLILHAQLNWELPTAINFKNLNLYHF